MTKGRIRRIVARAAIAAALVIGLGVGSGIATPGLGAHGATGVTRHVAVAATVYGTGWLPLHDR